jgi:predicted P-loop ATPase
MNASEVRALRLAFWKHGYRPIAVWNPDQRVNDRGEPLKNPGKQPRGTWRDDAGRDPPDAARIEPDPRALNTGILCQEVVGFDVDVLDGDLVQKIVALIEHNLGATPLNRIGRAPKILLVYRPDSTFTKVQTPELFFPDGTKAKVELLADGQQFVADGIHPDTGEPYRWTEGTPADVPLEELPIVTEGQAHSIIAEAELVLRMAGATEKEKPKPAHRKANGHAGDFFFEVNAAALNDIGAWAESIFPCARFEPGTGAWRVSSDALGRDLEEDISIHPDGIRDFGEEETSSAINLVIQYGTAPKPLDAALWLCERLKIDPTSLGYQAKSPGPVGNHAEQPTDDDEWQVDEKKRRLGNSQKNVRRALAKLGVTLRHDVFANRSLVSIPKLTEHTLDDPTLERLWLTIDETFHFRPTIEFFSIVLRDVARRHEFHPVLDRLDRLPWDGTPRMDDWLFTYGRVPRRAEEYNQYVRKVGRIILIAAVRRLRQPGCKFDEIVVFISETQGTDKSTALSILALQPEWFTDRIDLGAKDKEAIEQQQGKWIVEIPEMRGRRKNDVDRIKAFLSRAVDRARLAYGRLLTEAPRQCVYFGSANDIKFLRDRSGNRRFWPIVDVSFDVAALRKDVDQLWAEAVAAEKNGESIRLPPDLWTVAETVQDESLEEEPWVEVIAMALDDLDGKIRAADVWIILDVDAARRTPDADNRMGFAMRELGWTRKQRRYGGHPEWSYIKGAGEEQHVQITANRQTDTGQLRITKGGQTWTIDRGATLRVPL